MKKFTDFRDLCQLAKENGFVVTSTTGGNHNRNSKHYKGLAIDVRTRNKTETQCESFIKLCRSFGLRVIDERRRPTGQKIWFGAHLHIEIV